MRALQRYIGPLLTLLLLVSSSAAHAHGIWGHIHVTAWAIENLPPGELRDFFEDPEVQNAAHFGSAYTDTGYWPNSDEHAARSYGEHTHWEPFVEDFIAWIIENDPPPFTTQESKQRVAFLMGAAAHGLQDELFDSYMLDFTDEHDDGGQDATDPGTDGFLVIDEHIRFMPTVWLPMDALLELYATLDADVTEEVIQHGVNAMMTAYVSPIGERFARQLGGAHATRIPWTRAHYMDPNIPGSLRSEIIPTIRYLEALWARLHSEFTHADLVIAAFPEYHRRLLRHNADSIGSTSAMFFGKGVRNGSLVTTLEDADEQDVPTTTRSNRWGGNPNSYTRTVRSSPDEDLEPGAFYTLTLHGDLDLIDGTTTEGDLHFTHTFQVDCLPTDTDACPPLNPEVPDIEGPDTGDDDADKDEDDTDMPSTDDDSSGCDAASGHANLALVMAFAALLVLRRRISG